MISRVKRRPCPNDAVVFTRFSNKELYSRLSVVSTTVVRLGAFGYTH